MLYMKYTYVSWYLVSTSKPLYIYKKISIQKMNGNHKIVHKIWQAVHKNKPY